MTRTLPLESDKLTTRPLAFGSRNASADRFGQFAGYDQGQRARGRQRRPDATAYYTGYKTKAGIMVDQAAISRAVELLREAAPGSTIIVFGSYARGEADEGSDLDLLVIEPELKDEERFREMVRLRDVLRPL